MVRQLFMIYDSHKRIPRSQDLTLQHQNRIHSQKLISVTSSTHKASPGNPTDDH